MRTSTPLNLDCGITLENEAVILLWTGDLTVEPIPGNPEITPACERRRSTTLEWKKRTILGGMVADLRCDILSDPDPWSGRWFQVIPQMARDARDENDAFNRCLEHLQKVFGPPTSRKATPSSLADGLEYPAAAWKFDGVSVDMGIRENNSAAYFPYFYMHITGPRKK